MRLLAGVFLFVVSSSLLLPPLAAQTRKAAAPGAPAAKDPRTIELVATEDMKYSVNLLRAAPGELLRVRLTAKGTLPKIAMAHNFVLLKIGTDIDKLLKDGAPSRATDFIPPSMMDAVIAKTDFAGPGESVRVIFAAPMKPGRYPFLCTFAGHYQGGMKGTLVVK